MSRLLRSRDPTRPSPPCQNLANDNKFTGYAVFISGRSRATRGHLAILSQADEVLLFQSSLLRSVTRRSHILHVVMSEQIAERRGEDKAGLQIRESLCQVGQTRSRVCGAEGLECQCHVASRLGAAVLGGHKQEKLPAQAWDRCAGLLL